MSGELRYFKCNVLGGFRLSDLNKQIKQGEYCYIDTHVAETSRAVVAALRERWMIEVTEKEASKHINIPRISPDISTKNGLRETNIGKKGAVNRSANVAIPNASEVNENLESRQTKANKLEKDENSIESKDGVATPNVREVEKKVKQRQEDTVNKLGQTEVVKDQGVVVPNFDEVSKNKADDSVNQMGATKDSELFTETQKVATPEVKKSDKVEIVREETSEPTEEPKPQEKKEEKKPAKKVAKKRGPKKKESIVKKDVKVTALSDDSVFGETVTPNFDEKKTEIKENVKADLDKKIKRKRRIKRKTSEIES